MAPSVIISAAYGTLGDVAPMLALAQALLAAGSEVTFITDAYFLSRCAALSASGARIETMGTAAEYEQLLFDVGQRSKPQDIVQVWLSRLDTHYALLEKLLDEALLRGEKPTFVAHTLDLAVRVLEEKRGVKACTVLLQPWMLRSTGSQPTQFDELSIPAWWPTGVKALAYRLADWAIDTAFAPKLNAFRLKLGLKSRVTRVYNTWYQCAGPLIGLWPEWLATDVPAGDWPHRLRLCGFPLATAEPTPLPDSRWDFICAARDAKEPVVVVTLGTSPPPFAQRFFATAVAACACIGAKAVLICGVDTLLPPAPRPAHVFCCSFVPFDSMLRYANVFLSSGGFGGASQAMRAGVPQVVIPGKFDRTHNAHIVERLSVGVRLPTHAVSQRRLAAALKRAMSPPVGDACKMYAEKLASGGADGARVGAALIVSFALGDGTAPQH